MSKKGQRDTGHEQFWREVIAAWPKSGQSISAFCLQRGLSEASFYHWRRTFRERDLQPVTVAPSPPVLVPMRVLADTALEIMLPTRLLVRVPAGADAAAVVLYPSGILPRFLDGRGTYHPVMLRWLLHRLCAQHSSPQSEPSRVIVGSTGSGKSEGELIELVHIAGRRDCAVVLLDGHGPLAFRAAGHWAARGHESRMVYEPLHATDRVLCWPMLLKSTAPTLSQRLLEDAETRDEVAQCFLVQ